MPFIFANRSRPREDRYLHVRVALMCVGAGLGLSGMLLNIGWLVWIALAALLAALAIRHLRTHDQGTEDDEAASL